MDTEMEKFKARCPVFRNEQPSENDITSDSVATGSDLSSVRDTSPSNKNSVEFMEEFEGPSINEGEALTSAKVYTPYEDHDLKQRDSKDNTLASDISLLCKARALEFNNRRAASAKSLRIALAEKLLAEQSAKHQRAEQELMEVEKEELDENMKIEKDLGPQSSFEKKLVKYWERCAAARGKAEVTADEFNTGGDRTGIDVGVRKILDELIHGRVAALGSVE
ncbi:hypothetical protein ACMFMG_007408 [Clarireedia jacksonii]